MCLYFWDTFIFFFVLWTVWCLCLEEQDVSCLIPLCFTFHNVTFLGIYSNTVCRPRSVDNYKGNHHCAIHWIVIYLIDSAIQLGNNWALRLKWIYIYRIYIISNHWIKLYQEWFTRQKYYNDGHDRFCIVHKIFCFFLTNNKLAFANTFFLVNWLWISD